MQFETLALAADDIQTAKIDDLLALRVLLDEADPTQDIERDLRDLFMYPERLNQSCEHEWRVFVKRAVHKARRHSPGGGTVSLSTFLIDRYETRQPWMDHMFTLSAAALAHCQAVNGSSNVIPITRQTLKNFDRLTGR